MNILLSVCGGLVAFFEIQLLLKRKRTPAQNFLAIWFFFLTIQILCIGLSYYLSGMNAFINSWVDHTVCLVHGPMLWIYTCMNLKDKFAGNYYPHFLLLFLPTVEILGYYFSPVNWNIYIHHTLEFAFPAQLSLYVYWSIKVVEQHKKTRAIIDENLVKWLQFLCFCFAAFAIALWIGSFIELNPELEQIELNSRLVHLTACLMILVSFSFMINKTKIFSPDFSLGSQVGATSKPKRGGKPSADIDMVNLFRVKIDPFVETQDIFLDTELSLFSLAQQLAIPPHQLSKAIKAGNHSSFHDYINQYRVREVKRRLQKESSQQFTILAIALDCGFNSKATFNRAFKKHLGCTPTEYLKSVSKSNGESN